MKTKKCGCPEVDSNDAARYAILCNLIETIWAQSEDEDYYDIDFDELIPFTSPQARRIASFIESLYEKYPVKELAC
jgi:hypothetical protein